MAWCTATKHALWVELFKARWLWRRRQDNPNYILASTPGRSEFVGFLPGRDPRSLYINTDARDYEGVYEDKTIAEISGDEVDNCYLSEALGRLIQPRIAHEKAKVERARLANYDRYTYDDPLNDPRFSGPASRQRVNPRVPVVRTPQDATVASPERGSQTTKSLPTARTGAPGALENGKAAASRLQSIVADETATKNTAAPLAATDSSGHVNEPGILIATGSGATDTPPLSHSKQTRIMTGQHPLTPQRSQSVLPDESTCAIEPVSHSTSTHGHRQGGKPDPVMSTEAVTLELTPWRY